MMVWTRFIDMSSGGSRKEDFAKLYIEAPEEEARAVFYNRFGHNPDRVTCTCCGPDYYVDGDHESLKSVSKYDRQDGWGIAVIRAEEIEPDERHADIPEQGFVWVD